MDQLLKVELLSSPDLAPLYSLENLKSLIRAKAALPYSAIHQELTMRGGYEHSQRDLCITQKQMTVAFCGENCGVNPVENMNIKVSLPSGDIVSSYSDID